MARINEVIDGKYEIVREIGRGGMSVVYLAMDKRLNRQWAIKEFRKDEHDAVNKMNLEALLHEANIMKKLDHPTLPRIVDIIEENKSVYIVMDYIEGEPLNKVLAAYGAQPQDAVIEWAKQLSEVLDYLHTQKPPVIYRDMKPANIMLKPDGTIRLFDFGIAREYKEGQEGDTEWIGTRGYAAPEQFGGKGQTDARTDIYSFGVTLYHLVTGKNPAEPPYEIYPIRHWNSSLSSGLEWLIQKCTQLNPRDRYQSFAEVTYVLENLEKFEGAYKKKLKSRINQFITMTALTLVFTVSSAGFLLGANAVKSNNYQEAVNLNTIDGYQSAIEIDNDSPDAYLGLVKKLRDDISVIYSSMPSEYTTETLPAYAILEDDIKNCISAENLNELKNTSPEDYVAVSYELGRAYWNTFQDASGQLSVGEMKAEEYFKNVISTAQEINKENGGLSEQKFNLAKAYYLVSYFQNQKANLIEQDDGEFEADETAKYAGIYGIADDNTIDNPYYSFWVTNKELLSLISGENDVDIHDNVKLESLRKLAYIMNENYSDFYSQTKNKSEKVDESEMRDFFDKFSTALNNIEKNVESDENKLNEVNEIRNSLNNTIKMINSLYKCDIEKI